MSRDLCAGLKEMADNLAPSQQLLTEVQGVIHRLTGYLQNKRFPQHHSINRIVPLGSFAKRTSLRIMMDLDLVVYLNDVDYPFKEFLDSLEDHILLSDSYENCTLTGTRLFFVAEGTIHVDLLPATNRVPRHEDSRSQKAQKLQYDKTIRFIKDSDKPFEAGWQQSTALSETAVEFVKRKNERFHASTMARLAKFWSKTVCIEEFHAGRSSIMEYIAIRATELEQSDGRENTFKSFRRFLSIVSRPEEMAIYWTDYYREEDIQPRMTRQRPLLLDPTDPHNNLLRSRNKEHMKELAQFARVSLERLNQSEVRALRGEPLDLQDLFQPQPEWLQLPVNLRRSPRGSKRIHVSVVDGGSLMMPKSKMKSKGLNEKEREVVENFLFSFSEVSVANSKKKGVNVVDKVQRDVQEMIAPNATWGVGPEPVDADADLEIPFDDEHGRRKVLRVQFDMT